jgi:hypothetical protein
MVVRADLLSAAAFALAVISGAASAAVDITKGTWYGTNGLDGSLRGRDALGNPVNLLESGSPNPALKYLYDTQLDLTWLADGNAGAGSVFDGASDGGSVGMSSTDGRMTWSNARAWAASLTDSPWVTWTKPGDWSLPAADPACGVGFNCTGSPMATLYYTALGNVGYPNTGWGLSNTGPFKNLLASSYWLATEHAPSLATAWRFDTDGGGQVGNDKRVDLYALAVHPGDVAPIPEASTWAMLLVGLGALGAVGARRPR